LSPQSLFQGNAYEEELQLPEPLRRLCAGLREDKDIAELFGEKFIQLYTSINWWSLRSLIM